MSPANPDDSLHTTDHDPSASAPGTDHAADLPPGSSLADRGTPTYPGGRATQQTGAVPERAPATVSVPGFEIEEVLGRGGMGVVYKARHLKLKRIVALKMVLAGGHAGPRQFARFRIEAEAVARLQHPNIVQIHEVGEADGHPYCALEFVEGGNLARKLAGKPLPAREAAKLVEVLARAMQLAHSRNVVHRDLKPANIMLAVGQPYQADPSQGVRLESLTYLPKITDFGLARQMDSDSGETQAGAVMGTPSYMAPEQASGHAHEAGPTADVYSLGAILYDCLAGRPPFKSKSDVETLDMVRTQEPAPLSRSHHVPLDLETICFKCMRKEPERRYGSAAELADELGRFLRGEPILARPVGKTERLWRWCRRNPAMAAASGLAMAAVLATAVVSLWFGLYQQETAATLRQEKERTDRALEQARASLHEARRQSGIQMLERGQALCMQQHIPHGLYWLVRGLQEMPEDEETLRHVIRANLGQWLPHLHPLRAILTHQKAITVVAFSPDGKRVLTASEDGTARLWDATTGEPRTKPLVHGGPVRTVAFSPDGALVLTGGDDQIGRVWDVATGKQVGQPLPHEAGIRTVAFSPDGAVVLTGSNDRTAKLWNAATGTAIGKPLVHKARVVTAVFSPDSKTVLIGGDDHTARLWDVATGKQLGVPWSHKGDVRAVALSPDGKTALTGSADRTARLWDVATGRAIGATLQHQGRVDAVCFSPDGRRVLTSSGDHTARLWDAATGSPIGVPFQHQGRVSAIAFSPDGRLVLTGSDDRTAQLWEAATGRPIGSPLWHKQWVVAVAFSLDGKAVITGGVDGTARIWDIATDHDPLVLLHQAGVNSVAFHPDGKTMLTGGDDRTTRFWQTATGQPIGPPLLHRSQVNAVAVSADGKRFLVGSGDTVRVWETATARSLGYVLHHQGPVTSATFSPDGRTILTGSNDKTARLWRTATGRPLCPPMGHADKVPSVDFSPDGKTVLTATWARSVQFWDATTGKAVGQPLPHNSVVWSALFRPDGKVVLTHSWDHSVRQWDTASGQPIGTPLQLPRSLWSITWGHDGRTFVTGGMDFRVQLWDAATGRPIGMPWQHQDGIYGMAVSADGRFLLTGSDDKTVRRWPLRPPLQDPPQRLHEALTVLTGLEMDDSGGVRILAADEWDSRRRKLPNLESASWQRSLLLGATAWHTIQASAAEHEADTFAARWHLDRLSALEPNAWFWYARRARLHLQAGNSVQAEADDQRARRCAGGANLADWYRHQLIDSQIAKRWPAALWYVNRLLADRPRDGDLVATRARIHGNLGQPAEASADLARAIDLGAAPALISELTRNEALATSAGVLGAWLVLAPLPFRSGQSGADAIDVEQLPGVAQLRPQAGDKVRVGNTDLFWRTCHVSGDFVIDFNALLGKTVTNSAAYAVCYVVADKERPGLKLLVGSDDQSKIYLNGKEIYRYSSPRGCHIDEDSVEVRLHKGTNVLVFKVVNEGGDWKGCLRFVDRTGLPAKGLKVSLLPK